jgi:hypothetical protein
MGLFSRLFGKKPVEEAPQQAGFPCGQCDYVASSPSALGGHRTKHSEAFKRYNKNRKRKR